MQTSHASSSHASSSHPSDYLPLAPAGPSTSQPAHGRLRRCWDSFDESAKAAACWGAGTLGLGMLASASYYLPHASAQREQAVTVGGGLAGLGLFALASRDTLRVAHAPGGPERQARAHHALVALAGVVVGTALAGVSNNTVGTIGLFGGYFSAFVATRVLTHRLTDREASWGQAAHGAPAGSRWLAGAMVLVALGTLGLGWFAAAIGAALTHHSARAVTGRFVGAFVTATAFVEALPHLLWPPAAEGAGQPLLAEA